MVPLSNSRQIHENLFLIYFKMTEIDNFWNNLLSNELKEKYDTFDDLLSIVTYVVNLPTFELDYLLYTDKESIRIDETIDYDMRHKNLLNFQKIDRFYINKFGVITMFDLEIYSYRKYEYQIYNLLFCYRQHRPGAANWYSSCSC